MSNHDTQLIQSGLSIRIHSECSNAFVKFFRLLERILCERISLLCFFKQSNIFDKTRLDLLIVHKLRKGIELFAQKLVRLIDSSVDDADTVSP